jgi:hypothetical protein
MRDRPTRSSGSEESLKRSPVATRSLPQPGTTAIRFRTGSRALGQSQSTPAVHREALRIRQDRAARAPGNRAFRSRLARSDGYFGDSERESGPCEQASRFCDEPPKIHVRLFQTESSNPFSKFRLVRLQLQRPSRARSG